MSDNEVRLPGRQAEALRNDTAILDAARQVFIREPAAPMSAVAAVAGVGISALYKRYASKEELLRTLCGEGLERFSAIARAAAEIGDPWEALAQFVTGIVESDVHSLTVKLAGTFTPTPELHEHASASTALAEKLFDRASKAGVLRDGLVPNDLAMIFEQLASIRLGDSERTLQLRRRYLRIQLDALRAGPDRADLPAPAATDDELGQRWQPRRT
ncbi:TetR/AcrR family transcriptional regulator [Aeromicrobium sp.]|uniref:TetR/AcrR family transcriptional regulator n=1 Tax=Aeromicrobium sp. TaxID=1871063 RepID=UPI002FC6486E